jgi:hypothetical protein
MISYRANLFESLKKQINPGPPRVGDFFWDSENQVFILKTCDQNNSKYVFGQAYKDREDGEFLYKFRDNATITGRRLGNVLDMNPKAAEAFKRNEINCIETFKFIQNLCEWLDKANITERGIIEYVRAYKFGWIKITAGGEAGVEL